MTELYPFLAVRDVAAAVDFYEQAFDAVEEGERLTTVRVSLHVDDRMR